MEIFSGFILGMCAASLIGFVVFQVRNATHRRAAASAPEELRTIKKPAPKPVNPREDDWRAFISTYEFPAGVIDRALARCPQGTNPADLDRGLRQFFLACGSTADLAAAMPSKTVDEAWHEFLTYTRDYAAFSNRAFGQMLHHVPEVTMTATELDANHTLGMVTAWVAACEDEGIPVFGQTAPALFASDTRAVTPAKPSKLRKRVTPLSPAYVGFCGTNPADAPTTETCTAPKGTVCMRHAYAPDWRTLGSLVAKSATSTSKRSKAYDTTTNTSGYDSVMLAALIPVLMPPVEDRTPEATPPPASDSSSGSSSYTPDTTPTYVSSCSSSSSSSSCSSSSSSCSSSSSSCGGGGCGGGS